MSVHRGKGTKLFFYDFQHKKKRYTGPTGKTDRTSALRVERAARAKVEAGLGPDEVSDMTIDAAAARWFDEVGQYLKASIDYERSLDLISDCLPRNTKLREIDGPKVKEAMAKRKLMLAEFRSKEGVKTRQVKNSTINRQVLDILRRIHRHARIAWGARNLPEINWKELRLSEGKKREREISDEERDRLEAKLKLSHWQDFHVFLSTYGVRFGEMFFHPDEVFEVEGQVSIRIRGRKDGSTYTVVLLPEDGRLMLARKSRALAAKLETVWYYTERSKLLACTKAGARSYLRRAIGKAGIKNLTIHDHRHDVATKLARKSGIVIAQSQLGHADIGTTKRYVKVSTEDRLKALSTMRSREKSRDDAEINENSETNQKDAL